MITVLDIYRGLLHNLNKEEAPAMYPSDYSHFLNTAVNQYVNKRYNTYASRQQLTDDLRSLSVTFKIDTVTGLVEDNKGNALELYGGSNDSDRITTDLGLAFLLPDNYLHLLNCIATIDTGRKDCDGNNILKRTTTKRLTADMYMSIVDDYFQRPAARRPYHYIRENRIEIRWGNEGTLLSLDVDYLAEPEEYLLTPEMVQEYESTGVDTSQPTGFSRYVNYEILRELTTLILGRDSDPRIQSMPQITQSIP